MTRVIPRDPTERERAIARNMPLGHIVFDDGIVYMSKNAVRALATVASKDLSGRGHLAGVYLSLKDGFAIATDGSRLLRCKMIMARDEPYRNDVEYPYTTLGRASLLELSKSMTSTDVLAVHVYTSAGGGSTYDHDTRFCFGYIHRRVGDEPRLVEITLSGGYSFPKHGAVCAMPAPRYRGDHFKPEIQCKYQADAFTLLAPLVTCTSSAIVMVVSGDCDPIHFYAGERPEDWWHMVIMYCAPGSTKVKYDNFRETVKIFHRLVNPTKEGNE